MKKGDEYIYIGDDNEYFNNGQEVYLLEDLSEEAKAGMHNTPELIKVPCGYFGGNGPGIGGFELIKLTDLKPKTKSNNVKYIFHRTS